ncbi:MAG: GNAT family N-acetyltransferase [Clostridiales bacterium]|nr:GNAT family N-acetyltransferase [Clostridiales bacterium]
MQPITITPYNGLEPHQLEALYRSVGWTSYFRRPGLLAEAYARSLKAFAAWDGPRLVGVVRAVGDGVSILYIQDLIVHPEYQRRGIGSRLISEMLKCYPDVNQTVLLTDNTDNTVPFYEAIGFCKVEAVGCCSFIRLNEYYG